MSDGNNCHDLSDHVLYEAVIETENQKKRIVPFLQNSQACSDFEGRAIGNGLPKLYVIRNAEFKIVYVGKTTQSLKTRLAQGLNPRPGTGYHGYHWQDKEKVYVHCFIFNSIDNKELEATEAELVFQIRLKFGGWPSYQTEIHFHNTETAPHRAEQLHVFLASLNSEISDM